MVGNSNFDVFIAEGKLKIYTERVWSPFAVFASVTVSAQATAA
jgi:hypothetical protein